ncbi:MAG: DUF4402 domain-containing protein [Bacteroidota bacterium]
MTKSRLISKFLGIFLTASLATAGIVQAQTVTEDQALAFGSFTFTTVATSNSITVNADGTGFSTSANLTSLSAPIRGEYSLSGGTISSAYTIMLPASVILSGPGAGTMTMDSFTVSPTTLMTDGSGNDTFFIGGTLSTASGVSYSNGAYSGNLDITITF